MKKLAGDSSYRSGVVLLVTLVLLVVLSTLGYTLTSRLAAQRHRDRYIIDYQAARYGCNSAVKYALATLKDINVPSLIARPNEPDFSDLFSLSELEYRELLDEWTVKNQRGLTTEGQEKSAVSPALPRLNDMNESFNDFYDISGIADFNSPDSLTIRGPYGPPWPFITEPIEFEIGSTRVRIEIEDENAKYPIGWAMLNDENLQREARAGLRTFCEWMGLEEEQIVALKEQLDEISAIKTFTLEPKPIKIRESRKVRIRGRTRTRGFRTTTISAAVQTADFAKLFHSSLIDTEALASPTIVSESRKESALKYMGMWASRKVNINTAPRHVLEAAFTFGGDADRIAEEIIQHRRVEPFKDTEDLKKRLFRYSDSIGKCEKYIITASRFFTIKVTAVSGAAKASAIIAITKDGKKIERVAVMSG